MRSIIDDEEKKCFICGDTVNLERHHIFGGANRKHSEHHGLTVRLCITCHRDHKRGVHGQNKDMMDALHQIGQIRFEKTHTRGEFMRTFGKNYLNW